jgi:hypothetical protein
MTRQSQADRVLARLKQGPATTWDIGPALGILCPTRRIFELREAGFEIEMSEQRRAGKRVCTYTLKGQQELFGSFDNNPTTRLGPSLGLAQRANEGGIAG